MLEGPYTPSLDFTDFVCGMSNALEMSTSHTKYHTVNPEILVVI